MQRTKGFTLIEIMITVVIISILAAIAIPAYQGSIQKSRRIDAKASLLATAQILERCFTEFNSYNNILCAAIDDSGGGSADIDYNTDDPRLAGDGYYAISDTLLTANTYTIRATPTGLGGQDKDTRCTSFELLHTGKKESNATTNDDAGCWN